MDKSFQRGDRVRYTAKDGRIIFGTVKTIHIRKGKRTKKGIIPDYYTANVKQDHDKKIVNYRFKRLDHISNVIIPGNYLLALMPLITNPHIEGEQYKWIYTCGEGIFAVDQHRMFVENMAGLKIGCIKKINDKPIKELRTGEIKKMDLDSTDIKKSKYVKNCVELLGNHNIERPTMQITFNTEDINRAIKNIPYHKGKYGKPYDTIDLDFNLNTKTIIYLHRNKKGEAVGEGEIEDMMISCRGKDVGVVTFKLWYLKELFRWIRTKEITLNFAKTKPYVILEGELQKRILYYCENY